MTNTRQASAATPDALTVLRALRDDPKLTTVQFAVAVVLLSHGTDDCRPSMATIAREAKCNIKTARVAVRALEEAGWIRTQFRKSSAKDWDTNLYRFNTVRGTGLTPVPPGTGPEGYGHRTRTGTGTGPEEMPSGNALRNKTDGCSLSQQLQEALPDATDEERELVLTDLEHQKAFGKIRSVRAYLRTVIANGDAGELLEQARQASAWEAAKAEGMAAECGRPSPGSPLSEACRIKRGVDCVLGWCRCQCHGNLPSATDDAVATAQRLKSGCTTGHRKQTNFSDEEYSSGWWPVPREHDVTVLMGEVLEAVSA